MAWHKSYRSKLYLPTRDATLVLLGREHVVDGVVERTEIGIDLLLHVAGEEAEPFTGLDGGPRQDQTVDAAADQLRDGLGHRDIGLAGACGAEREDHLVARQGFHVERLHGRAWNDGLLARADHHPRRRSDLVLDDAVEAGLSSHAQHRVDRFRVDVLPVVEPIIKAGQHVAGACGRIRVALDLYAISAR